MSSILNAAGLAIGGTFCCPLCDWQCPVPPEVPDQADTKVLARDRVEREVYDHLSTHSMSDWVGRVVSLKSQLEGKGNG